jgi:hypothetical protein
MGWSCLLRVNIGLAALLTGEPALACINSFTSQIMEARETGNDKLVAEITASAEQAHRNAATLENTNDLAVAWILTGRMPDGIELLRDLEKRQSGNAIVAANLGTALELSGADEEALQWIRESVRRDPREHGGSEWLHVKILEAKLALKLDPNWLRKNSVVGWREGQRFPLDERSRPRTPKDIIRAINYQLQERTRFVSAPDAIVGDLYLTMGDIAQTVPSAISEPWERDRAISSSYDSALKYGTVHESRAREHMLAADLRMKAALPALQAAAAQEQKTKQRELNRERVVEQRKSEMAEAQQRRRWLALAAFGSFGVVLTGVILYRRRRRAAGAG